MIVTGLLVVALTACGGGGGEPAPNLGTEPPGGSEGASVEGDSITGTFGGDAELEGGCAWVDDGKTRWSVQYPDEYQVSFDPLKLTGPDGIEVSEGDTITVTGSSRSDIVTTCQTGPVWAASSVVVTEG